MIRIIQNFVCGISLRAGLLLLLGVIAAVLITDQVRQALQDREAGIRSAQRQLTEVATHAARRQADMVREARALLGVISVLPEVVGGSQGACHQTLASVVKEVAWLTSVTNLTPNGHPVCGSNEVLRDIWVGDRPYFIDALASRRFVLSDYIIGRGTGRPGLMAAMPRIDAGGVASVLVGFIDLDWLSRLAADARILPESVVLLADSQMTVVAAYPQPKQWIGRPIAGEQELHDFIAAKGETAGVVRLDGKRWIAAHQRLSESSGQLIVLQPEAGVLANVDRQARLRLVKISLLAAILSLAVWLGGEYLVVRPIGALSATAARLGAGDLAARVSINLGARDFRVLSQAMNDMAGEYQHRDSELHNANNRLQELASTDGLTGLANRRLFDQTLGSEWARAARDNRYLAVIQIDVDHFKEFNDHYGHLAGDDCLRAVAGVIASGARRAGDLAGRTGGEEFTLLLPKAALEHGAMIAEQVRKRILELGIRHAGSPTGYVSISAGVASVKPGRDGEPAILVEAADRALYLAKRAGRNRVETQAVADEAESVVATAAA